MDTYIAEQRGQLARQFSLDSLVERVKKYAPMNIEELAVELANAELINAANRAVNAGFNGSMGDDGAGAKAEALRNFLDGIVFAYTGETIAYKELLNKLNKEKDSEYQEYLRLKAKFEE